MRCVANPANAPNIKIPHSVVVYDPATSTSSSMPCCSTSRRCAVIVIAGFDGTSALTRYALIAGSCAFIRRI